jgi:hypothetical protein
MKMIQILKKRNEFKAKYYSEHGLTVFNKSIISDKEVLEISNLYSLFWKDYYAIFRLSLLLNFINISKKEDFREIHVIIH